MRDILNYTYDKMRDIFFKGDSAVFKDDIAPKLNELESKISTLQKENDELKEYIRHKPGCKQWSGGVFLQTDIKCTCGLDNLVSKQVITLL